MSAPTGVARPKLGRVGGDLAEALAWLNSPAAIAGEIARLESLIKAGDDLDETYTLLRDWEAVREAQRRMVAQGGGPTACATTSA